MALAQVRDAAVVDGAHLGQRGGRVGEAGGGDEGGQVGHGLSLVVMHRAAGWLMRLRHSTGSRIVTNSSAAVGWMPMVLSNTALVAPAFIATAKPCTISPASAPTMCRPTTRSVASSTTSFISVRSVLPLSVCLSALKSLR